MRKLSIVIITHNNYKLKCGSIETVLLALENQTTADFDVLIVDNNSDIDDYLILKSFLKTQFFSFELHVIRNNCNSIAKMSWNDINSITRLAKDRIGLSNTAYLYKKPD